MSLRKHQNAKELLIVSAALFLLSVVLCSTQLARDFEARVQDSYVQLQPATESPREIALVLIDDRSLQEYGRWPWSRELLAQLIRNIDEARPRVIGVDILLTEPQSEAADGALAAALRASNNAVLVGKVGTFPDGPHWLEPLPLFTQIAAVGHAQAVLDPDGVCRRFPVMELSTDGLRYAFSIEVARKYDAVATRKFLNRCRLDTDSKQPALTIAQPTLIPIAYHRTEFLTLSAADVLQKRRLGELSGRAVLIGFGPSEISDRLITPLSMRIPAPGAEINAQILNDILHDLNVREIPAWCSLVVLLFMSPALIYCFHMRRAWMSPVLATLLAIGVYAFGYLLFRFALVSLATVPLFASTLLTPMMVYAADFLVAERRLSAQLRDLRHWLNAHPRSGQEKDPTGVFGHLSELGDLQTQLGALYELHEKLLAERMTRSSSPAHLEATDDAVAVFNGAAARWQRR